MEIKLSFKVEINLKYKFNNSFQLLSMEIIGATAFEKFIFLKLIHLKFYVRIVFPQKLARNIIDIFKSVKNKVNQK